MEKKATERPESKKDRFNNDVEKEGAPRANKEKG